MNSPVEALLIKLIDFDKTKSKPLYIQVSEQIVNLIQRGYLIKGTLLPGTRVLSELLKVHRNTAVAIYDELAAQGWVEILPNKGTFVLFPEQKTAKIKATVHQFNQAYSYSETTGFPFQNSLHLASTQQFTRLIDFVNNNNWF